MLKVVEKFLSINGESTRAGELAAFIRFKGCNLNCSYCDTRWANLPDAEYTEMTAEQLLEWVKESKINNVTLTGGEPVLQKDLPRLCDLLIRNGNRVEIETNGSVSLKELASAENRPVFTMDYKLPSSGMESEMCRENFSLLKADDTVKFVVGSTEDLETAARIISEYKLTERCNVYLSPVFGKIEPSDMVDFMLKRGLNGVRLQLQLHKFIWEPEKRGV